jgi:hypothetical protein
MNLLTSSEGWLRQGLVCVHESSDLSKYSDLRPCRATNIRPLRNYQRSLLHSLLQHDGDNYDDYGGCDVSLSLLSLHVTMWKISKC